MIEVYIYVLTDPRDDAIRYVGATIHLEKRLWEHLHDFRSKCHRTDWIKFLLENGLKPQQQLIETSDDESWASRERYWIKYYRGLGCDLTNATDGGDGNMNPSAEIRKKISESRKRFVGENHPNFGKTMPEEQRKKISIAHIGKVVSQATIDKLRATQSTKEWKDRASKAQMGKPSPMKGKKHSPESTQKMSDVKKGKPQTAESNAKRSVSLMGENNPFFGKKHTDESKKKIGEARMGEKNPLYGTHLSDDAKENLRQQRAGKKRPPDVIERIRQGTIKAMRRIAEAKRLADEQS